MGYIIEPENGRYYVGGEVDISIPANLGIYRAVVDWGDGSPFDGWVIPSMVVHVYDLPGVYTLALSVYDAADNLLGTIYPQITVEQPNETIGYLRSQVTPDFDPGQANALITQLNAAEDSINRVVYDAAAGQLSAFAHLFSAVGPDGLVPPPNIAFDMAEALRGWVAPPD